MSHDTYNKQWHHTQDLLNATLQLEPTQADRRQHRTLLATLYLRYIVVANRLAVCVDQMIQPQKRLLIRKLLEATLGRILELKTDLVEADLCEWTHCGDVLEHLGLTPYDVELKVPSCFRRERREELEYRRRVIDGVLGKLGFLDRKEEKPKMTEQQAILIIQIHERARQGRLRAQFMKEIHNMRDKTKPPATEESDANDKLGKISLSAAMCIQKVWRGYTARRATRRRKLQEMLLIGMIPQPNVQSAEKQKALENEERRRQLQEERRKEYEEAVKSCRERLEKYERGAIMEQLSDQVRSWLHEYRASTGKLPEYTGSDRTSSRLMLSRQGTDSDSTQASSKESKLKKPPKSGKSKDSKSTEESEDEAASRAMISSFVPELNAKREEFEEIWKNKNESINPRQFHYNDIIEHEQMTELEDELRKIVDEMMRSELQLLQEAFDKDRGYKGKKPKKASKKIRAKKAKKKKEKDLTPDRTTESLFEELVANGIIKKCPEVYLTDFIGERSCNNPAPYNKGKEAKIGLGDVRQILVEYCVVPLLTQKLHENTPHVKSVLIAAPKDNGKDMLAHAICTEAGATLFDLTPANIVGKYPGKSGLTMLIHLVSKVARLLQPSVIFMDCAERPFVKKIPKTDKTDPKRLKKDLPKLVKNLSPEDRVLLIGITNCPWESDQKLLQQVYQKYLVIPRPDYTSLYSIWSHFLGKYSAISWQFDTSAMTRISDGYTTGAIISTIQEVMTVKRTLQLRVHPLNPLELVNVLCKKTPVYKEEEEAMEIWWTKTPTCRRRLRAMEQLEEEIAELQAKQASAKMKKQISKTKL